MPILKDCLDIKSLGEMPIEDVCILDIGITDEETTMFLVNYALPTEKQLLELRGKVSKRFQW